MMTFHRGGRLWAIAGATTFAVGCGSAPGEPIGAWSDELTVCAKATTVEGIDVSTYQGTINWAQVATSNVRFAITRISDGGNYSDVQFDRNWAAIKNAGLVRGAYQFFEPGQDPTLQANMVVAKVGKLGPGDLPVTIDVEAAGGQSPAIIVAKMKTWIDRVATGTGKQPTIYSAKYFWNDNVGSTDFATNKLWVANYGVTCPTMPDAWSNWTIWQYSDNRTVPGITGGVDADRFNGTLDDLKAFAGTAVADGAANDVLTGDSNVAADEGADGGADGGLRPEDMTADAAPSTVTADSGAAPTAAPDAATDEIAAAAASIPSDDPGCACRVTMARHDAWGWLLVGLLPWLRRRRFHPVLESS